MRAPPGHAMAFYASRGLDVLCGFQDLDGFQHQEACCGVLLGLKLDNNQL